MIESLLCQVREGLEEFDEPSAHLLFVRKIYSANKKGRRILGLRLCALAGLVQGIFNRVDQYDLPQLRMAVLLLLSCLYNRRAGMQRGLSQLAVHTIEKIILSCQSLLSSEAYHALLVEVEQLIGNRHRVTQQSTLHFLQQYKETRLPQITIQMQTAPVLPSYDQDVESTLQRIRIKVAKELSEKCLRLDCILKEKDLGPEGRGLKLLLRGLDREEWVLLLYKQLLAEVQSVLLYKFWGMVQTIRNDASGQALASVSNQIISRIEAGHYCIRESYLLLAILPKLPACQSIFSRLMCLQRVEPLMLIGLALQKLTRGSLKRKLAVLQAELRNSPGRQLVNKLTVILRAYLSVLIQKSLQTIAQALTGPLREDFDSSAYGLAASLLASEYTADAPQHAIGCLSEIRSSFKIPVHSCFLRDLFEVWPVPSLAQTFERLRAGQHRVVYFSLLYKHIREEESLPSEFQQLYSQLVQFYIGQVSSPKYHRLIVQALFQPTHHADQLFGAVQKFLEAYTLSSLSQIMTTRKQLIQLDLEDNWLRILARCDGLVTGPNSPLSIRLEQGYYGLKPKVKFHFFVRFLVEPALRQATEQQFDYEAVALGLDVITEGLSSQQIFQGLTFKNMFAPPGEGWLNGNILELGYDPKYKETVFLLLDYVFSKSKTYEPLTNLLIENLVSIIKLYFRWSNLRLFTLLEELYQPWAKGKRRSAESLWDAILQLFLAFASAESIDYCMLQEFLSYFNCKGFATKADQLLDKVRAKIVQQIRAGLTLNRHVVRVLLQQQVASNGERPKEVKESTVARRLSKITAKEERCLKKSILVCNTCSLKLCVVCCRSHQHRNNQNRSYSRCPPSKCMLQALLLAQPSLPQQSESHRFKSLHDKLKQQSKVISLSKFKFPWASTFSKEIALALRPRLGEIIREEDVAQFRAQSGATRFNADMLWNDKPLTNQRMVKKHEISKSRYMMDSDSANLLGLYPVLRGDSGTTTRKKLLATNGQDLLAIVLGKSVLIAQLHKLVRNQNFQECVRERMLFQVQSLTFNQRHPRKLAIVGLLAFFIGDVDLSTKSIANKCPVKVHQKITKFEWLNLEPNSFAILTGSTLNLFRIKNRQEHLICVYNCPSGPILDFCLISPTNARLFIVDTNYKLFFESVENGVESQTVSRAVDMGACQLDQLTCLSYVGELSVVLAGTNRGQIVLMKFDENANRISNFTVVALSIDVDPQVSIFNCSVHSLSFVLTSELSVNFIGSTGRDRAGGFLGALVIGAGKRSLVFSKEQNIQSYVELPQTDDCQLLLAYNLGEQLSSYSYRGTTQHSPAAEFSEQSLRRVERLFCSGFNWQCKSNSYLLSQNRSQIDSATVLIEGESLVICYDPRGREVINEIELQFDNGMTTCILLTESESLAAFCLRKISVLGERMPQTVAVYGHPLDSLSFLILSLSVGLQLSQSNLNSIKAYLLQDSELSPPLDYSLVLATCFSAKAVHLFEQIELLIKTVLALRELGQPIPQAPQIKRQLQTLAISSNPLLARQARKAIALLIGTNSEQSQCSLRLKGTQAVLDLRLHLECLVGKKEPQHLKRLLQRLQILGEQSPSVAKFVHQQALDTVVELLKAMDVSLQFQKNEKSKASTVLEFACKGLKARLEPQPRKRLLQAIVAFLLGFIKLSGKNHLDIVAKKLGDQQHVAAELFCCLVKVMENDRRAEDSWLRRYYCLLMKLAVLTPSEVVVGQVRRLSLQENISLQVLMLLLVIFQAQVKIDCKEAEFQQFQEAVLALLQKCEPTGLEADSGDILKLFSLKEGEGSFIRSRLYATASVVVLETYNSVLTAQEGKALRELESREQPAYTLSIILHLAQSIFQYAGLGIGLTKSGSQRCSFWVFEYLCGRVSQCSSSKWVNTLLKKALGKPEHWRKFKALKPGLREQAIEQCEGQSALHFQLLRQLYIQ